MIHIALAEPVYTDRQIKDIIDDATAKGAEEDTLLDLAGYRSALIRSESGFATARAKDIVGTEKDAVWGAEGVREYLRGLGSEESGIPDPVYAVELGREAFLTCSCREWDDLSGKLCRVDGASRSLVEMLSSGAPGILVFFQRMKLKKAVEDLSGPGDGAASLESIGYSLPDGWTGEKREEISAARRASRDAMDRMIREAFAAEDFRDA